MMGGAITDSTVSSNEVVIARSAVATLNASEEIVSLFDGASQMTYTAASGNLGFVAEYVTGSGGSTYSANVKYINFTQGTRGTLTVAVTGASTNKTLYVAAINDALGDAADDVFKPGDKVRFFWNEKRTGAAGGESNNPSAVKITISPNTLKFRVEVYKNY